MCECEKDAKVAPVRLGMIGARLYLGESLQECAGFQGAYIT